LRNKDSDPIETNEWLEAINSVIEEEGVDRASYLLTKIAERLNQEGAIPSFNNTF
jgi:pyruvate dehydrogenase E1 component